MADGVSGRRRRRCERAQVGLFLSTVDIISLIWESVSVSLSSLRNGAVDDRFGRFGLLNRLDTRTSGKRRSMSSYSTLYY